LGVLNHSPAFQIAGRALVQVELSRAGRSRSEGPAVRARLGGRVAYDSYYPGAGQVKNQRKIGPAPVPLGAVSNNPRADREQALATLAAWPGGFPKKPSDRDHLPNPCHEQKQQRLPTNTHQTLKLPQPFLVSSKKPTKKSGCVDAFSPARSRRVRNGGEWEDVIPCCRGPGRGRGGPALARAASACHPRPRFPFGAAPFRIPAHPAETNSPGPAAGARAWADRRAALEAAP
jgi:hypothetical protein